ncbi:DUF4446 family protein [Candidatus Dojkabacteria bacterium]|nr:DUF4446 family protein [Candidatus Dojkabacteria bacterium]
MNNEIISIISIVLPSVVSLAALFFAIRALKKLKDLSQGVDGTNLEDILKKQIEVINKCESNLNNTQQEFEIIRQETKRSIQKVGLVRYQAFRNTGGDQSFSLTLLDNNNNGVIITGLYNRDFSKVYTKQILNGSAEQHKLTDEEGQSLQKALSS